VALGLGLGLGAGPATAAAVEAVPREKAGAAAGVNSMMRYIGGIAGIGILSAILENAGRTSGAGVFGAVYAVLLVVALLAACSTLSIRGRTPCPAADARSVEPGLEASPLPTSGGHR
jgi:MFS family permease